MTIEERLLDIVNLIDIAIKFSGNTEKAIEEAKNQIEYLAKIDKCLKKKTKWNTE